MKVIRWWGLAAFVGLVLLMCLFWYLLAPYLIKNGIQDLGSEALGAKVEVSHVELTLFPLSVSLNQLVATDPNQPMQNIFDSEKITFSIDSNSLLWKKLVIEELNVSGIKTGTQRQTSGALQGGRKSTQAIENFVADVMPEMANIDIKDLVEKADLITLKRIKEFKLNQSQMQDYWKTALDKAAFEKRLESINSEYDRLAKRLKDNKLNLIKDKKEWGELKKAIDTERKQISELSEKIAIDKKSLSSLFSSVKNGPDDDKKAIMDKLGVSNGIDGLVDRYIGPQYTPWVNKMIELTKGAKTQGAQIKEEKQSLQVGQKVYFNDHQVLPELLIKKIILSGASTQWRLHGKGFDLGYFPWLTGKPAKLNIDFSSADVANQSKGKALFDLSSDWPSANKMLTKLDTQINNWPISSIQLMQTEAGSWTLISGNLGATINGELSLEKIDLTATFNVASPKLNVPENISGWQKTLASSISDESNINFKLSVSGDISDPKIKLDSSLEKLFKNAIGAKVKQEAEKLTDKIKQSISEKVGDISALENFNGIFSEWQSQISSNDNLLKGILDKIKI